MTSGAFASCLNRPDLEELISEPVTVTRRDPDADFASFTTFAVAESIPLITSLEAGATGMTVDPAMANPTLEEIAAQLSSRGYERVARTEGPDWGVAVIAVNRLQAVVVNYGSWWGSGTATSGYWGYPGGSFAGSLGYSSVAWQSGTLIIELYDLRAARDEALRSGGGQGVAAPSSTASITVSWAALIHGVIGGPGATLAAPPIEQIRQAFTQSPYLTRPKTPSEVQ